MKYIFKLALCFFLNILGINALCRLMNRHKALILWYHGVSEEDFDLLNGYDERHLPKTIFRKQLDYLKRKGYIFVNMTELMHAINDKGKIDRFVVLTFDDGFRNVVENAYPIMKEFGAKGCFYLVSDLIGKDQLLWTDYVETVVRNQKEGTFQFIFKGEKVNYGLGDKKASQYAMKDIKAKLRSIPDKERYKHLEQFNNIRLNEVPKEFLLADWEQVRKLDPDVLEIGSHTRQHPNCTNLVSDEELEHEIHDSKSDIEKNTERKVDHFCYPAGAYNEKVISTVKKSGYTSATTTKDGFIHQNSDGYQLKRIGSYKSFVLFKANISGSYNLLRRLM